MQPSPLPALGFIGGTGAEGAGLALRFAHCGHAVAIGSRSLERATAAAESINQRLGTAVATPYDNSGAARAADVLILSVPYAGQDETLRGLAHEIGDRVVISVVVPLTFQNGRPLPLLVAGGSAAQEAQRLLPQARVVGAFHHLGARHLTDLEHSLEGDILVVGDDAAAKETAMGLVAELRDLRAVDVGGLDYAQAVESFTAVLLSINRRHRILSGITITGL